MLYAVVADCPSKGRWISIHPTPDQALLCEVMGNNLRIVPIPDSISGDVTAICNAVTEADQTGRSVQIK